jgi:hypothetical protein
MVDPFKLSGKKRDNADQGRSSHQPILSHFHINKISCLQTPVRRFAIVFVESSSDTPATPIFADRTPAVRNRKRNASASDSTR